MKPLFGGFFPMAVYCADGAIRWGEATADGGEVAYLRHATLRFAYRVTEECRRSATRECKPRDDVYTTALRR